MAKALANKKVNFLSKLSFKINLHLTFGISRREIKSA